MSEHDKQHPLSDQQLEQKKQSHIDALASRIFKLEKAVELLQESK